MAQNFEEYLKWDIASSPTHNLNFQVLVTAPTSGTELYFTINNIVDEGGSYTTTRWKVRGNFVTELENWSPSYGTDSTYTTE